MLISQINLKGTKPFLMGDEPIEVDCAIFGMLAQVLWNTPRSPFEQVLNGKFTFNFWSTQLYGDKM